MQRWRDDGHKQKLQQSDQETKNSKNAFFSIAIFLSMVFIMFSTNTTINVTITIIFIILKIIIRIVRLIYIIQLLKPWIIWANLGPAWSNLANKAQMVQSWENGLK